MLLQKIGKKKVLLGYKGMLLCLYKKLYLWFFSRYFNFHRWHTSAPYECRPYKNIVSKNSL